MYGFLVCVMCQISVCVVCAFLVVLCARLGAGSPLRGSQLASLAACVLIGSFQGPIQAPQGVLNSEGHDCLVDFLIYHLLFRFGHFGCRTSTSTILGADYQFDEFRCRLPTSMILWVRGLFPGSGTYRNGVGASNNQGFCNRELLVCLRCRNQFVFMISYISGVLALLGAQNA